jgi:hypothetical protein
MSSDHDTRTFNVILHLNQTGCREMADHDAQMDEKLREENRLRYHYHDKYVEVSQRLLRYEKPQQQKTNYLPRAGANSDG